MQSAEDFDSTSSIPVFGSAVTQSKLQQQQQTLNNESGGMEKLVTPPQPVANGESDTSGVKKTDDHVGNGTGESHHGKTNGNGKHDQPEAGTIPPTDGNAQDNGHHVQEATSNSIEKTSDHDAPAVLSSDSVATATPLATSTIEPVVVAEPEPSSSTPADVPAEPSTVAAPVPASASQTSVVPEMGTPERPSQSPRSKRKSPAISTPPTRHSARGRKTASPASKNDDDDATNVPTADLDEPSPSAKRPKRQAVTSTKETTVISTEQNAVLDASLTDEVNNPTNSEVADADEEKTTSAKNTPSPRKGARGSANAGRKRGASSSPPVSAAKKSKASPRGKKSIASNAEQNMDVDDAGEQPAVTSEQEAVQTPTKKARTSGTRKTSDSTSTTPESSGEYARKLRPRK